MSSIKILVTGSSGFVGRHVVGPLASSGYQVLELRGVDLLADGEPRRVIEHYKPDLLLHLAWYAKPGKFWDSAENWKWVESSIKLFKEFGRAGGTKALSVGTCAEYDWSNEVLNESFTDCRPATIYGQAKNQLHQELQVLSQQCSIPLTWARLFWLYGPWEPEGKLVSSLFRNLMLGNSVSLKNGSQRRDFMHVSDVGRALAHVVRSDFEGAINIGSGSAVSIKDIAVRIGNLTGRKDLVELGESAADTNSPISLFAEVSSLNSLSFRPEFDLDGGLQNTHLWWKKSLGMR